jgi:hypothetical protein
MSYQVMVEFDTLEELQEFAVTGQLHDVTRIKPPKKGAQNVISGNPNGPVVQCDIIEGGINY